MSAPPAPEPEVPPPDECRHIWNSTIMRPSKVIESDWCTRCGVGRPGYLDPREKWKNVE